MLLLWHRIFTLHKGNEEVNQREVIKLFGTLTALLTKVLPDVARGPGLLAARAVEMVQSVQEADPAPWLRDLKFHHLTQQTLVSGKGRPGSQ